MPFFSLFFFLPHSLRLRKDIRTLFANHSVCNAATAAITTEDLTVKRDLKGLEKPSEESKTNHATPTTTKKKAFLCKFP